MHPNLRHARLFCTCLSLGSVTGAAIAVGVSQPAASQALARLEELFGVPLLEQRNGRLSATEAGSLVQVRLQRALDMIKTGCLRLRPSNSSPNIGNLENRLSISHLRAISAVAAEGGFSAAARLLHQSEPAVQKMARGAEDALETELFEGSGRNLRLSNVGTTVARWSRLALNEFESAVVDVRELRGDFAGETVIGTLPLARTSVVPNALANTLARYPLARLSIVEGRYDDLRRDLEMGRIDLLIGALRPEFVSQTLIQEELFTYWLSVVARVDHPLAKSTAINAADLAQFPWIVARQGTPSRRMFQALAATFPEDGKVHVSVETGSLVAMRGILMQTEHLTLLSRHQIAYEERAGLLKPLAFSVPDQGNKIGLTRRKHWYPTMLQAAFLSALRDVTQSEAHS